MKKHMLKYWGLLCMLMLMACQQQDADETEALTEASLTVTFKTAANQASSRAVDEDLTGDGTVDELDQVVDGQRMYRLAVALVDNGTIIASEQLNKDDGRFNTDKDEATVTFNLLEYGKTYQLIAVANYDDYDTNITGNLANVDNLTGTNSVTANNTSLLCPKNMPYPLSLKKEITLQPGANTITGELVRTYARLRIHVRNLNQEKPLKITGLTLGDKFTQPSADLFVNGGAATITPNVESIDAITPFANPTTIPATTETTIFDAYLLESQGGNYTYTLNLEYEGTSETVYTVNTNNNAITNPDDIDDGGMYVIYNTESSRYLYADGTKVSANGSYISNNEVDTDFVWRFIKKDGNGTYYFIESMGETGSFMQSSEVTTSSIPLVANKSNNDYFTLSEQGIYSKYLRLQSSSNGHFLSVNSNGNVVGHSGYSNQERRNFRLYKVEETTQTKNVTHAETIPISVIDKETGESVPITSINRNDFIDILVNVNYNEKTGTFLFEVVDWEEKEGEMEFN